MKASIRPSPRPAQSSGQILAVFAIGLFAMFALVALVIEGGNIFAQQRIAQNGADAAATAGALVVAENLSGVSRDGQDVLDAVNASATANALATVSAEYTDDTGQPIGQAVGPGAIPANARGSFT